MAEKNKKILLAIVIATFLLLIAISFNFSAYLRGPAPYAPDWRWAYQFTNTLNKIWLPTIVIFIISFYGYKKEGVGEKELKKHEKKFLFFIIVLCFIFQLSVLFYSRAGIFVLVHRIIDPKLNGYFSASLPIRDISTFLQNYNALVLHLPMHAQGHPPGAILFYWVINKLSLSLSFLFPAVSGISSQHSDIEIIWKSFNPSEKIGTIISSFAIPLLSCLIIMPLYYLGKKIFDIRVATRSAFLYVFIPSTVLFLPLNDVFLAIFPLTALCLLIYGLKDKNWYSTFFSGVIFSVGLFFSLSLLPLMLLFVSYLAFYKKRENMYAQLFYENIFWLVGFSILPLLLYFLFKFNFFLVAKTIMGGLPQSRAYSTWVFYNIYDFLLFIGIPIAVLFIIQSFKVVKNAKKKLLVKKDILSLSFLIMFLLLDFSGSVRGEVARIWLPFMPFTLLIVTKFITSDLQVGKKFFLAILLLQAMQIIAFQTVLVTLW